MLGFVLLAAAAVLLAGGAELFAEHAAGAGRRLGVTALGVGLVLAGAEPEELLTAVTASVRERPGLAAGDAIGANVTMLTAVLGLLVLTAVVPAGHRVRRYAVGASMAGVAAAVALADDRVSRPEGVALALGYVVLVALVWRLERQPPAIGELAQGDDDDDDDLRPAIALLLVLGGIALMTAGGWLAVEGATRVVEQLDVAETAVGLTFVALATTAELFALAWSTRRRGVTELAVAGIVGSTAYNALASLGAAAAVRPIATSGVRGPALAAAILPLALVGLAGRRVTFPRPAGLALLAAYALFVATAFA